MWIRLPRKRRPADWDSIADPVIPHESDLYGLPLAGHLWERELK